MVVEANAGLSQSMIIEPCTNNVGGEAPKTGFAASAHVTGNDSWQQVGLMLVAGFTNGWIMSFSCLIMAPLGWTWGLISLFVVGFFTAYANWLLAAFHFIDGQRFIRYRDLMGYLFGKKMYYLTWVFQFLAIILGNMGFILLGGKALKEINLTFADSALRLQYFIIITGVAYFVFTFVVPNMSAMRLWLGASFILTFSYIVLLLVVVIQDGIRNNNKDYQVRGSKEDKVFNAIGAMSAIFAANTSGMLPEIQSTLRKPAVKNMRKSLCMMYTVGLSMYYGVCISGYWAYGAQVSAYLPEQLSGPKWVKIAINAAIFLQNIVSQHMFIQPVLEALDTKFLRPDEAINSKENWKRRFCLRLFVFTGHTLVTAAIPYVGDFLNLLGSFSLVPLTSIFPSMIFLMVKSKTARPEKKVWHWILISVFSLVAVATTASALRLIVKNISQYRLFADA